MWKSTGKSEDELEADGYCRAQLDMLADAVTVYNHFTSPMAQQKPLLQPCNHQR